jgi:hypothetical protein
MGSGTAPAIEIDDTQKEAQGQLGVQIRERAPHRAIAQEHVLQRGVCLGLHLVELGGVVVRSVTGDDGCLGGGNRAWKKQVTVWRGGWAVEWETQATD